MNSQELLKQIQIEYQSEVRNGIYGYISRTLAYNSNKIEGSNLTEDQTSTLFDYGWLSSENEAYITKDIEEMQGHFFMFNHMLETINEPLTEDLIKRFHYELKIGVFEDKANGYAIGEYKKRPNIISHFETTLPNEVSKEIKELLLWYQNIPKTLENLTIFHAKYEQIHPFQDGNGRTGRIILFRETLMNNIKPFIIENKYKSQYINALIQYRQTNKIDKLIELSKLEQNEFYKKIDYFSENYINEKDKRE